MPLLSCLHWENLVFLTRFFKFRESYKFFPCQWKHIIFLKEKSNEFEGKSRINTQYPSRSRNIESELDRQFPSRGIWLYVRDYCLGCRAAAPHCQRGGTCNFDRLFYICQGPLASLRSEAAGLFSILQKEERYNGHVQLMSFPDCLVLLIILSKWVPLAAILQVSPLDFLRNMRCGNTSHVAVWRLDAVSRMNYMLSFGSDAKAAKLQGTL